MENKVYAKLRPNPNPNPTTVGGWVGFSANSSSTRPAGRQTGRPASQRSTFKPQFTLNIKITFVSSVIKCQKMLTFNNFPSNLPIHQTWKGFRSQLSQISINLNFKSFSHLCPVRLMIITLAVTITKLRPKAQHNWTEISFYFT